MSDHPSYDALFLSLIDDPVVDPRERRSIATHLELCGKCSAALDKLRPFVEGLSDPALYEYINGHGPDREALRALVVDEAGRLEYEASLADDFYAGLSARPLERWPEIFDEHPGQCTAAMAARILRDVEREMNRLPQRTLQLLAVAETIVARVEGPQSTALLGDVWKQRANAYRHLFRYRESLDAADLAEQLYARLRAGDFDVAQARYTAAVTLFKMTEWQRTLDKLDTAMPMLRAYGLSVPYVRALILQASTYVEQGSITRAIEQYRAILPMLEQLGEKVEEARVLANLGDCNLRLGNHEQAVADAAQAIARFVSLEMDAESIRSTWTLHLSQLRLGDRDALDRLHRVAARFEHLGMTGDAAFVRLDMAEELLRRGDWTEAAAISRHLVDLFTRAGVTVASIEAAHYLRQAIESREATPDLIPYIRDYIAAADPKRPFAPPRPN